MNKKTGYVGNRNATKADDDKATETIQMRCKTADKIRWKASANEAGLTLTEFITKAANAGEQ